MSEILRVPYNYPGSQAWGWVNIYTRLSQERILFLNQALTDGVANSIISAMLYLESEDQTKPIALYINSLGDPVEAGMASPVAGMMSIAAGMAIYDTMQHLKSEIVAICIGQARGMAALLLAAGTKGKRLSLPHSMISLNLPRSGMRGQASDIEINAQATLAKQRSMIEVLSLHTGQPVERITRDVDRDFYLTPEEAQAYGLIDKVLESPKVPHKAVPVALIS
jgi:ATP-dependent Clp protease protease subunit